MRHAENILAEYLAEIKDRKIGFMESIIKPEQSVFEIFLDARYDLLSSECLFDDCNDEQAIFFLEAFLKRRLSVGWSVSEQLSKLLSKRGHLVGGLMDSLLVELDFSTIGNHLLFLSYLCLRKDGAMLAMKFLDAVPEDGRDGLFLACFKIQSEELDSKLQKKFLEWEAEGWSPCSTGEIYALEKFITKWIKLYPYQKLEALVRLYFKYCEVR